VTASSARSARLPQHLLPALALVVLSLASCVRVSRWLLVGTWVMTPGMETVEFREDGTLRTVTSQGTFDGRWEILGARTMRVTVKVALPKPPAGKTSPTSRKSGGKPAAKTPVAGGKTAEPVVVKFRIRLRTLEVAWPNGARSSYYRPR